ncbi:C4-type zinc ribbon domain-containing protein [Acidobacteria bacterium AH-259-D05]|nr:C4-type zinc ribbon domain-containing protein [Acidobacteria bacterium AH-259-D05]
MNTQLQKLIDFQELDLKVNELRERTQQIPESIETINRMLDESRKELEETQMLLEEDNSKKRQLELEVEALRDRLSKYRSQLMEVKTNKEYQAVLHEIGDAEEEIKAKEDQILEGMLAIEEREEHTRKVKEEFQRKEKGVLQQRSELEKFVSEAEARIESLQKEKSKLVIEIPEELSQQYQKIASVRNGLALAEAKDQSCQACHVKLRPQLFAEIKTNQRIITCENCNRFLYFAGS